MNSKNLFQSMFSIFFSAALLAGCAFLNKSEPIKTTDGDLAIKKIQITGSFPPNCYSNTPGCVQAWGAEKLLIVWLVSADGNDSINIWNHYDGAYVSDADGSVYEVAASGWHRDLGYYIAFKVKSDAQGFALHWPENPLIDLGK